MTETYITKTILEKEYHLTDKWISRLGGPDKVEVNPHYRSAAFMKLWRKDRVEEFLDANQAEYSKRLAVANKRRAIGIRIAEKKRQSLLEWARSTPIRLRPLEQEHLRHLCELRKVERGAFESEVSVRDQINFIRHERSNYHGLLDCLKGQVGRYSAYYVLRRRVNDAICLHYGFDPTPENTGDSDGDAEYVGQSWGDESEESEACVMDEWLDD